MINGVAALYQTQVAGVYVHIAAVLGAGAVKDSSYEERVPAVLIITFELNDFGHFGGEPNSYGINPVVHVCPGVVSAHHHVSHYLALIGDHLAVEKLRLLNKLGA